MSACVPYEVVLTDLVGSEIEKLVDHKLPTNRDVLRLFFYKHNTLKVTIRQSANQVIETILNIWSETGIPTNNYRTGVLKLEKLYKEWTTLKKNVTRKYEADILKRKLFEKKLDGLFDRTKTNIDATLTDQQRNFLHDQRTYRFESISSAFGVTNNNDNEISMEMNNEIGN